MSRPCVLVTETLADAPAAWLGERAQVRWVRHDQPAELEGALPEARALIVRTYTQVDEGLLARAPHLAVVGRAGVGLDNIDLEACRRRGVRVVYSPDANTQAVVEYVLGLILDELRPRVAFDGRIEPAAFHQMRKELVGRQFDHLALGILGFGRIGRRLCGVAHALGVKVLACDLLPEAQLREACELPFEYVDHAELYARSDVLSIHVDGRPGNRGLIDQAVLGQLKPDCLLINAARGMLVEAEALAKWLRAHPRARAVLDVHEPEPPPGDYPLYDLPNARLLPHLAARTEQALENMSWVVRDVWRVLEGERPHDAAV